MSDQTSASKKVFNVNSVTVKATFDEQAPRFKQDRLAGSRKRYNVLTGQPELFGSKSSHHRRTMLPPPKNFINNGHGKQEYRAGLAASPKVFYRQNGDFTHF